MRLSTVIVLLVCVTGCLSQGAKSVYFVRVETEPLYTSGVQEGITVFLVFLDRNGEEVSFSGAESTALVSVYQNGLVYEKEISFDSSVLVGREGGGIQVRGVKGVGDVRVVVKVAGRGEFRSEKKKVTLG